MPPKAKLHNRNGKLKSFPRSKISTIPASSPSSSAQVSNPSASTDEAAVTNNDQQFEVELCWCIHQLEEALSSNKLSPKQVQETVNILNVLKSKSQLTVRKRQLMRTHFGDYRAKMAAEEKKAKSTQNKISFMTNKNSSNKSTFLRKSAILTTGDNTFKFNFQPQPDTGVMEEANKHNLKNDKIDETNNVIPIKNKLSELNLNSSNGFMFNFNVEDANTSN